MVSLEFAQRPRLMVMGEFDEGQMTMGPLYTHSLPIDATLNHEIEPVCTVAQ
jgi:hypothetical protein